MNPALKYEIDELLYLTLENSASPDQIRRLDYLLDSDPEIRQYAADFYFITASLRKTNAIPSASLDTEHEISEQCNLLLELAHEERTAPVLKVPDASQHAELIRDIRKNPTDRSVSRINRMSIAVAVASLAALLILIAYVRTVPPRESVAVLVDTMNAQWQDASEEVEAGHLFYNTDGPLLVKSGIVEIEFDYGARVVIEGPCEFACKADNLIYLHYGRLYARVPQQATGFTVDTRNARIVDLGTEFGVQENIDETTEVHVIKGRTTLLAGQNTDKKAFEILQGQACQVTAEGASVQEISLKDNAFVQQINSRTGLVRKGQTTVDLADIVGGGNGFGTGSRNLGINPSTGLFNRVLELNRNVDNRYQNVRMSPFIDGVFVPNGRTTQVVSSLGHTFADCPLTQGNYYSEIAYALQSIDRAELVLGEVNYSQNGTGSLLMHANLGITYDLRAIRSQLADARIARFQSTIGICDTAWRACNAEFWILVDGQVRYASDHVRQKGIWDTVDIELSETDRFLTLLTTDGGDPQESLYEEMPVQSMDSDWCLFARPVLILE